MIQGTAVDTSVIHNSDQKAKLQPSLVMPVYQYCSADSKSQTKVQLVDPLPLAWENQMWFMLLASAWPSPQYCKWKIFPSLCVSLYSAFHLSKSLKLDFTPGKILILALLAILQIFKLLVI